MRIADRDIGPAHEPFIIAELGVNHDGSIDRALGLVDAAADAGATAVKTQIFLADLLMSRASLLAEYQATSGERDPVAMLRRVELGIPEMVRIIDRAHELGLAAIATIFSTELVGPTAELEWDALKSASPDIVNKPLLDAMAATGLPLIVSTGASTIGEVARAVEWLEPARDRLSLLQCVSAYPAPEECAALGGIGTLAREFGLPVGYSDHTTSIHTGALAVAAGACILEKHLTHDRAAAGPDHAASLDPDGFARYVRLARGASLMMGTTGKTVLEIEEDVRAVSRQSVVAKTPIRAGDLLTHWNITVKRPGSGIPPWRFEEVLGRAAARDIGADEPILEDDLS